MFIDLIDASSDDDAIEENVARLDEDVKNQVLFVFFKYLMSNREKIGKEIEKVKPKTKQSNPFIDDEEICDNKDVSSNVQTEQTDKQPSFESFLDNRSFDEVYDPSHVLIGRNVKVTETGTPVNIAPSTHPNHGKSLGPPIPGVAGGHYGGKSLIQPPQDSDNESSTDKAFDQQDSADNKSQSYEGKTPEDEDDKDDESNLNKSSEVNKDNDMEVGHESPRNDCNDEDGNGVNHSGEGDPLESSGNVDDVIAG